MTTPYADKAPAREIIWPTAAHSPGPAATSTTHEPRIAS